MNSLHNRSMLGMSKPRSRRKPRELTSEEAAEIKEAFHLFDADKSGTIGYRELKVRHHVAPCCRKNMQKQVNFQKVSVTRGCHRIDHSTNLDLFCIGSQKQMHVCMKNALIMHFNLVSSIS